MTPQFTLADYDTPLAANTAEVSYFSLISMHKWTATDVQTDNAGHQITGVSLTPTPTKPLTRITIAKPADGQYLVFWGATGIATSPVDAGAIPGLDSSTEEGGSDSSVGATDDSGGMGNGSSGGASSSSGGVGSSGATSSGASSGVTMAGSDASSSGGGSSGTGTPASGGGSNGGCSLSGSSRTDVAFWGSMLALGAIVVRRRVSRSPSDS